VAAHRDLLALSVLEACGQLAEGAEKVLVVAFDDELPAPYAGFADEEPVGYALGLLLSLQGGQRFRLSGFPGPGGPAAQRCRPQALALHDLLSQGSPELRLEEGPRAWLWQRV
jgi:hypothetical protein